MIICPSKKKIFATEKTAQQYIAFQKKQQSRYGKTPLTLYIYHCLDCRFYHLTSSPPSKDNPRYTQYKKEYRAQKKAHASANHLFQARRKLINTLKRYLHLLQNPKDTQLTDATLAKRARRVRRVPLT